MMMMNNPEPTAVSVEVIRPFTIDTERHEVGDKLEMSKHQAREFMNMGKVREYTEPEPEAKPKGKAAKE